MNLAEQLEPEDLEVNETYPLSKYFEGIITALLNASQQEQLNFESFIFIFILNKI